MSKKDEDQIKELRKGITDSIARWKEIDKNGCSDPNWPDGCNMNLCRNHVIYYKGKISELCRENGECLPEEYYLPVPPRVNEWYMARSNSNRQKIRMKKMEEFGKPFDHSKHKYDENQLSLF